MMVLLSILTAAGMIEYRGMSASHINRWEGEFRAEDPVPIGSWLLTCVAEHVPEDI